MSTDPPLKSSLRQALQLALVFALLKLAVQVIANIIGQRQGYGFFRDELYYLVCGRQLAWGYVDQQPIVALEARVTEWLFGLHSLALLRIFSSLAGAAKVFLTGMLAWTLGGGRLAQSVAMTAVLTAGIYLGIDSFLSMNALEPVLWTICMLAVLQIARATSAREAALWWTICGISGGLALETKLSAVFFLASLLAALLLSPQRRLLWNRWMLIAVSLAVVIELPNAWWQFTHHFPTLQWLSNVSHSHKDVKLGPIAFLRNQIFVLNPISALLWLSGLIWLLFGSAARRFRFAAITFLLFIALMVALHAKDYYVVPIYPVLFAAGGAAWQQWFGQRKLLIGAYCAVLVLTTALFLPAILPILPPQSSLAYSRWLHFRQADQENHGVALLPQFYADRLGWQELADNVDRVYAAMPAADRAQACIFGSNYGEVSAVNVLSVGLPFAISGHQNYFYWGSHGCSGKIVILMGSDGHEPLFKSCTAAASLNDPYVMPDEQGKIYLCRGYAGNLSHGWQKVKLWY
jgi:hypothetical protein